MASFSLPQVAQQLDLSEGTVKRLGHMLGIPARTNGPAASLILRYGERDVEQLKTAQALLAAGKSFEQIQAMMRVATGVPSPQRLQIQGQSVDASAQALMEIEASPLLKARMAEETLEAYQASRRKKPMAPLKSLARAMAYPIVKETDKAPHFILKPAFAPVVSTHQAPKPPSWMSHKLREQAVALKRQLVTTP